MELTKLKISLFLLLIIIGFGTFGYTSVEHMAPFDAFYMTLITISTVGFGEITPLSQAGRAITVIIIIAGISLLTYTLGQIAKIFIEGELREILGRRKLGKQISGLTGHFIVCGFGRIGEVLCKELADERIRFVVIEKQPEKVELLEKMGYLYIAGDATADDVLLQAGLLTAKGLATAVTSDADNVFITLTAKGLKSDVFVLSRAADLKNEKKLLRAGASRVICPYNMGGARMAQILKKPTVVDFLDKAMMSGELGLKLEEAVVQPSSLLVGKTLFTSNLRRDFGVIIVAIKKASCEMVFNPGPEATIDAEDVIVAIGKQEDIVRMRRVLA
ncbi:MAG: NAD-binding protein [Desulfofustis sp.]|jgi:voltage-gated potassium channel|nr:NAD-binding protein [Desulfofustis sp.]